MKRALIGSYRWDPECEFKAICEGDQESCELKSRFHATCQHPREDGGVAGGRGGAGLWLPLLVRQRQWWGPWARRGKREQREARFWPCTENRELRLESFETSAAFS